jgi:hypothetical protein
MLWSIFWHGTVYDTLNKLIYICGVVVYKFYQRSLSKYNGAHRQNENDSRKNQQNQLLPGIYFLFSGPKYCCKYLLAKEMTAAWKEFYNCNTVKDMNSPQYFCETAGS